MFAALARHAEGIVSCIDHRGVSVYVNSRGEKEPGLGVGRSFIQWVGEPYRAELQHAVAEALASGEQRACEFEKVLVDGTAHWFATQVMPFLDPGGEALALLLSRDVTGEKVLAADFHRVEDRYRKLVEHLPDFVVTLDRERRYRWVNRLAPGLTMEDVLGARIDDFSSPETLPKAAAVIEQVFATGEPASYEVEGYRDGTSQAWYNVRVVSAAPEDGEARVLALTSDITERKLAEVALRHSEARFRALAENSPDFIVVIDREHRLRYLNRAPRVRAMNIDHVLGRRVEELIRPEDHSQAIAAIEAMFQTGQGTQYEAVAPGDGALYHVRVVPFVTEDGQPGGLCTATDITEQRENEEARASLAAQLHHAQRLESIGLLAGGIAHDFNNLLQVITSTLYYARRRLAAGDNPSEELGDAERAAKRAAELTAGLLAVGRRQAVDVRPTEIGDLVGKVVRILRRTLPPSIDLAFFPPAEPCIADADPPQIEQVVLNLCLNARDAMPSGGSLTIRVDRQPATQGGGDAIVISLRDTGHGLDEAVKARMFEPFFTTKPLGQGTGLGLAVVDGIIAGHRGTIRVSSEVGAGAEFVVELPASSDVGKKEGAEGPPRGGTETILVAEDEPAVLQQVVRILTEAGYRVLQAQDGEEAVKVYRAHQREIALLLLDVVMPRLGGWDAFRRIAAREPRAKVVFTSGYAASALPEVVGQTPALGLISKPYAPDALLHAVRRALDAT